MAKYIELEAALKVLRKEAVAKYPASFYLGIMAAAQELENAPSTDVAPVVHERWKEVQEEQWMAGLVTIGYECSKCGCGSGVDTNYCPNCGARMDGDG